ncbi:MAG: M48 family metallopeptidase [Bacteroidetes bacterium]|nr:M48 family metallopeptidase [Bacteroidota bacterium]
MHTISIGNMTIDVVRKEIKNMHLAVYPPYGRVRVAAPLRMDDEAIRLFVQSKIGWIRRQQSRYKGQNRETPREYVNRESHYFQGKRYLLRVNEQDSPPRVIIKNKTYLDLYVRPNATVEQRKSVLNEWYRKELRELAIPLVAKWEPIIGIEVNELGIKLMKTKWGTCNIEARRIWINLELAKKPVSCLEYILVHEMIHLLERHHNDRFKAYLKKFIPNWKLLRDELNQLPASHWGWKY